MQLLSWVIKIDFVIVTSVFFFKYGVTNDS